MGKPWAILFGVTMAACGALFVAAPFFGWWLPAPKSENGPAIDFLFYVILYITGFFFILTEAILVAFMFRYGTDAEGKAPKPGPSKIGQLIKPITNVLDSPHKIEIAWTIIPAAILLYIAFAQVNTWADNKYRSRLKALEENSTPVNVDVSARQFEWRMRYPSAERFKNWVKAKDKKDIGQFAKHPHFDDVHSVNQLHCWVGNPVVVHLSTRDVLHSFNMPSLRVKQDALPGKVIPVWFTPTEVNTKFNKESGRWEDGYNPDTTKFGDSSQIWEIACAELCGWGHYRMIGRIYVHESQEDFLAWLDHTAKEEKQTQRSK